MQTATFAGGCFWCTEAIFQRLKGVTRVTPGYSGGNPPVGGEKPTYESVSSGTTGHAEVIQIEFDPKVISYQDLLEVFFATHDPTTMNRQGADVGTQYRSAIFYADKEQKKLAEEAKAKIEGAVTEITKFKNFTEAEDYHKDYYNNNQGNIYCKLVIDPKIKKLMSEFGDKVKS